MRTDQFTRRKNVGIFSTLNRSFAVTVLNSFFYCEESQLWMSSSSGKIKLPGNLFRSEFRTENKIEVQYLAINWSFISAKGFSALRGRNRQICRLFRIIDVLSNNFHFLYRQISNRYFTERLFSFLAKQHFVANTFREIRFCRKKSENLPISICARVVPKLLGWSE